MTDTAPTFSAQVKTFDDAITQSLSELEKTIADCQETLKQSHDIYAKMYRDTDSLTFPSIFPKEQLELAKKDIDADLAKLESKLSEIGSCANWIQSEYRKIHKTILYEFKHKIRALKRILCKK